MSLRRGKKPERYTWESRRSYKRRLEGKPLQKQEDPGKFVITSSINGFQLHDCLCDTGANEVDLSQPTFISCMVWEGSKRNQLILGTPFLAIAGAVINYFKNHLFFGHIRQDVFFQSINFKSVPSATKLPREEATLMHKKEAMLHGGRKESEHYPKPKEKKKSLELKHKDVFKDINSILLPAFDEYGAEEEPDGVSNLYHQTRIFTSRDSELKDDRPIKEKLERTMKLFPKTLVFKDDMRDDLGVAKPPQEPPEQENGEAKGILNPSATLPHA
ncbi:unnamed protein product [Microthlaspi erraticum]|uniref:Aspartic peptidase DDI1-type domain-containing protein n=1 Tax=Microthlaspi erraticum TaxID=1685480 RepID=A0A6D2JMV0_9BRAS|nr:unnamed protein product [Microthlaspi erraticum]